MNHIIKIKKIYYDHILSGKKNWELRKDDRNYKIGDTLQFIIIENDIVIATSPEKFTITYIFYPDELGIMNEFCIMSIEHVKEVSKTSVLGGFFW